MAKDKLKLVVITGAGISVESGIETYRDKGGLWEKYDPKIYCHISSWNLIQDEMNEFYNDRRKELGTKEPNDAHKLLKELEKDFDVTIITQNVDDLHERAGSSKIIHLHGELTKVHKEHDQNKSIRLGYEPLDLTMMPDYRPSVVFFGEQVPNMSVAEKIVASADIVAVCGTQLAVYPAASLVEGLTVPIYLIDPADINIPDGFVTHIKETASVGMKTLINELQDFVK